MAENKNITTVTIGIPAYNEEANILYLLNSLLSQKEEGFYIEKILVISDGSSDGTEEKVRACNDSRITLISGKNREGKPARLNQIFSEAQSDIVVILDADIKFASQEVIKKLVEPLIDGSGAKSTSGYAIPLEVRTYVQRIAMAGVDIWELARKSKYSSPLYLSEGRIRAFTKEVYKKMRFPQASADEAFSFLFCAANKYPFVSKEEALVYYNLPETLSDYLKQYKRFIKSQGIQELSYDEKFIKKYYTIGLKAKMIYLSKTIIRNPFWTLIYLCIVPITRILCALDRENPEVRWEEISSSKMIEAGTGKKKIIFSSYDSVGNPYYNGGGALAIHEVAKRLADKYDVTVICGNYPHAKKRSVDGVCYEYVGLSFLGPKLSQLVFQFALPYHVIRNNFDIWVESFTPPFSTSFLAIFTKKPVIGLVHMLAAEDMRRKYKLPFQIIENIGVKGCKNFIVSTEESGRRIKEINPHASLEIIPNGVEINLAHCQLAKKHLLFIGRFEMNQKGLDLLLNAYSLIAQKTDLPLVIAGDGSRGEKEKLLKMIQKLGISAKVKLLGRVEGTIKKQAFQEATAVIVPSRFETFSLTALEALSHGVPVVSFDIEGLKWLPEDFSYKAEPFDVMAMAKIMQELSVQNGDHKMNMEKLNVFLRDYNWDNIAEKYERHINGVLGCKGGESDINLIVKEIIGKKTPCVFISPHLDDAILSSGGLLLRLALKTETTVVTVFTEASGPPYTFSAKVNLKMCGGYKNAQDLFRSRRTEDASACLAVGAKYIHLGFEDASFRKKHNASMIIRSIGKILPEAEHVYPTYRFNIISGKISKRDSAIIVMLEKKLKRLKKRAGHCIVFCPLGIGGHVDHIIVRNVCRKVFSRVVFWEDFPYNQEIKEKSVSILAENLGSLDISDIEDEKKKMITLYESQAKSMFPNGINLLPESYYVSCGKKIVS